MVASENIRLQVHHIDPTRIYGNTTDGSALCAEITDTRYLSDVEALHEGDMVMLIEATPKEGSDTSATMVVDPQEAILNISKKTSKERATMTLSSLLPMNILRL